MTPANSPVKIWEVMGKLLATPDDSHDHQYLDDGTRFTESMQRMVRLRAELRELCGDDLPFTLPFARRDPDIDDVELFTEMLEYAKTFVERVGTNGNAEPHDRYLALEVFNECLLIAEWDHEVLRRAFDSDPELSGYLARVDQQNFYLRAMDIVELEVHGTYEVFYGIHGYRPTWADIPESERTPRVVILQTRRNDIPELREIWFSRGFGGSTGTTGYWENTFDDPKHFILSAMKGEKIVGFAVAKFDKDENARLARLQFVGVTRDEDGKGVGYKLRAAISHAASQLGFEGFISEAVTDEGIRAAERDALPIVARGETPPDSPHVLDLRPVYDRWQFDDSWE